MIKRDVVYNWLIITWNRWMGSTGFCRLFQFVAIVQLAACSLITVWAFLGVGYLFTRSLDSAWYYCLQIPFTIVGLKAARMLNPFFEAHSSNILDMEASSSESNVDLPSVAANGASGSLSHNPPGNYSGSEGDSMEKNPARFRAIFDALAEKATSHGTIKIDALLVKQLLLYILSCMILSLVGSFYFMFVSNDLDLLRRRCNKEDGDLLSSDCDNGINRMFVKLWRIGIFLAVEVICISPAVSVLTTYWKVANYFPLKGSSQERSKHKEPGRRRSNTTSGKSKKR